MISPFSYTANDQLDRQSTEITAYPTFILLSAINGVPCIIPVMCCRNVGFFYGKTSVFTLKYAKMLFNAREVTD